MSNPIKQENFLKDNFDPLVEAHLTHVVHRLRGDWVANIAVHWTDVCAVNEIAVGDLEKRITTLLRESFFKYSQLLAGFEILILQIRHFHLVREQTLLGLQQLSVGLSDQSAQLFDIAQLNGSIQKFFCGCECRCRSKK